MEVSRAKGPSSGIQPAAMVRSSRVVSRPQARTLKPAVTEETFSRKSVLEKSAPASSETANQALKSCQ